MNILLLTDWTYPCDHQFLTNVYAENFVKRGHDVTWVMRPDDPNQTCTEHQTWNHSDVYVLPTTAFNPVRNYLRYRTGRITENALFSTDIDFADFDVVHVRNDLPMGLAAAHIANTRDVAFAHQISHLKAETLVEGYHEGFENRAAWVKGHLGQRLRRTIAVNADTVLPISEAMKQYLSQSGYEMPMEVLPTGTEVIDEVPNGEPFREAYGLKSEYLMLYMGTLTPLRRLDFLFDVLAEVNEKHDTELVIAGGRFPENRERLQRLASQSGMSSKITFTGWISDRNELHRAVAAADVGVSPLPTDGLLRTNAPIKTLEYMSLRTPVVASATPDQQSVLDASGGGFAVNYTVPDFSVAVSKLLNSEELRRKMGSRGHSYTTEQRNFEVLTERTEKIYERMIEQ
ncbi:group 1 glycosyl transferase [Haloprofundus marisrubri]|uniref:Group 1 glycosyl transferase n=1 Tax=Haloprofundus marisrubri TaxID=1514971 RepID=A0A0W1R6B2_9EURY|nr:glycosyltransferase [Haloprofundus marisrubri]KTG09030.1 group 1 glycosyl transferase [Haloprofundus marisrubri]